MSKIAELNDRLRKHGGPGRLVATQGVNALGTETINLAVAAMRAFDSFTPDNDPYGEHDFGSFEVAGHKLFWKIEYYNRDMSAGSENPEDEAVTMRVLTIMLAADSGLIPPPIPE